MAVVMAVVGDVHGSWDAALSFLKPDVVLFTGDFGDEDVKLVKQVSKLGVRKAAILGNHDSSWGWPQFQSKKKSPKTSLFDMEASARKIVEVAASAPHDHALIFLGHSGPTGLGSQPHDICGKDFSKHGGYNGDPDLEQALKECRCTRRIPLVVFGHTHHKLMFNLGHRKMCVTDDSRTVYVNGAVVPRQSEDGKHRQFTVVELSSSEGDCKVKKVYEKWVSLEGPAHVAQETILYSDAD